MSNPIDIIAAKVADHLPVLILGMRERIEASITDAVEAAQDDDAKAILRIPVAIVWDIDARSFSLQASVSTRCKAKVDIALDDPDQTKLPLDGDGDEVPKNVRDAVGKIVGTLRDAGATVTAKRILTCTNGGPNE